MILRKFLKVLFSIFIISIFYLKNSNAIENKILFKVNNEIITSIDIYEELKFLKVFNPELNNLNDKELLEVSKNSIIRDKIKKIEIINYVDDIKVEDKFFLKLIKGRYSKIGLDSIESFEKYLEDNALDVKSVKEKFAIELIWNDLIFQKYSSKILIDKNKIKEKILKDPQKKMGNELLLSEILFNVEKKSNFQTKYEKILLDIKETGFKNAALIHSESDTATNGGLIGWIKEDNLNKSIKEKISKIEIGQFSEPIRASSGFIIIKIEDKKEYEIEFNLEEKINEIVRFKTNEQLISFSNIHFNKVKKDLILNDL
jgi:peptidyl-prolyl cis-trans isomerase SurA